MKDINNINSNNRYSRQIMLEDFGIKNQKKLNKAKILVVGAGGLGSSVLFYLAAAGVGTLGIVDYDIVTITNLNRQIIHNTKDIGIDKVISSEDKIKLLNPEVNVIKFIEKLTINNINSIVKRFDIVVDCSDNFITRYLVSDCCYFLKKPVIEGSVSDYDGIVMTIIPDETPCYRCLYKEPEEELLYNLEQQGILGALAGVIGSIQALEAIKVITDIGNTISGRILSFDSKKTFFREIKWKKRNECPLCGENPKIKKLFQY
ncbi:MAG: HesA/MoeB/ThiF family protein [Clostridiales bacterium]